MHSRANNIVQEWIVCNKCRIWIGYVDSFSNCNSFLFYCSIVLTSKFSKSQHNNNKDLRFEEETRTITHTCTHLHTMMNCAHLSEIKDDKTRKNATNCDAQQRVVVSLVFCCRNVFSKNNLIISTKFVCQPVHNLIFLWI